MPSRGLRTTLVAGLLAIGSAAAAGELRGRVQLELPGLRLADVGPIVVYLEPAEGQSVPAPPAAATLRQKSAKFTPPFQAVARGQTIEMPNDDDIFHNVFSFSAPNDFDLGLYAAGAKRSVSFRHPGPVRIYCSIHESMSATIFVAPTPWFALTDAEGRYAMRGAPAGQYRLRTWSEKLPAIARSVTLDDGVTTLDLSLAEAKAR
jgi:plastocyanin